MRVYCLTHKTSSVMDGTSPVLCKRGAHALGASPSDENSRDRWEYCCNCQNFWRLTHDGQAAAQCPQCDRELRPRYLCERCHTLTSESPTSPIGNKDFTLTPAGAPEPSCPGCGRRPAGRLNEHTCEPLAATYRTALDACPFCRSEIATPPAFPLSVTEFLRQVRAGKKEVGQDQRTGLLVESPEGAFVLAAGGAFASRPVVVPRAARFGSKEDFYNHYQSFYACDEPGPGEVRILYPCAVEAADGGWKLKDLGRLEVVGAPPHQADWAAGAPEQSVYGARPQPQPVTRPCPACGAAVKVGHNFCKQCGRRLDADGDSPGDEEPAPAADTDTRHDQPWDSGAAVEGTPPPGSYQPPGTTVATEPGPPSVTGKTAALAAAAVIGIVLVVGVVIVGTANKSVAGKLDKAIAAGNLFAPAGESAYDLYRQFKTENPDAATLKRYEERLYPLLTQRPQQMIDEVASTTGRDASASEWIEAQQMLAWASELRPSDKSLSARGAFCAGRASYVNEDRDAALKSFMRARELDPGWAQPDNSVGVIYNEKKQYATARQYLAEAIDEAPQWALPYNNMGTSYFYQKDYYQAAGWYRKALEREPQWARPHAWLGSIAVEQKDYCTAAEEFQTALDLATPNMSNWNPQTIRDRLDKAKQKCQGSDVGAGKRIRFGAGGTTASLSGTTGGTDAYVLGALATQVMTISLSSQADNARMQLLNPRGETLGGGTWWSGTLGETGDYRIHVEATSEVASYTLQVTIPPPSR